ncbi:MAG: DUF3098 domain-containing protein [Cryomorphaceae bacterium]|jgi:hypothetical protein|nr:DUF3098 domain-containing protein [Cryomorphaceae bacterium]
MEKIEKTKESLKELPSAENHQFGFKASNYKFLLIGLVINVIGFLVMIGGGSTDPNKFDANELFSFQRITLAPMLIVAGYVLILFSIMRRPKNS